MNPFQRFPTPAHCKIKILIHIRRQTWQRVAPGIFDLHLTIYPNQTNTWCSAATNLAKQGLPLDFIANLGGWKKLETLKKYLLASGLDVAMVAEEYEFYK